MPLLREFSIELVVQEMIYSGPFAGSVCPFCDPFSGSRGNGANAHKKYQYNRLFFKNKRLKQNSTGQFSGLRLVAFSATPFQVMGGEKRDGNGHCCLLIKSRRRKPVLSEQ